MPPKTRFTEGEKVLCFHGPLLYEAKCISAGRVINNVTKYFVHYQGWNKSWDEWVSESRILKYNDANITKQRELAESYNCYPGKPATTRSKSKAKKGANESTQSNAPMVDGKGTKQKLPVDSKETGKEKIKNKRPKVDPHVETEETYANKLEIRIKMPDELKPFLMDDWDLITRQKKLLNLPARITVDQILEDYINFKKSSKGITPAKENSIIEVTNGFREYFNVMLGSQLLYKFERPQYQQFLNENADKQLASVYGFIHLLRLFARLGGILIYTSLDEKEMQLLLTHVHDFLRYLAKNPNFYSPNDYDFAPPEYHKKTVQ